MGWYYSDEELEARENSLEHGRFGSYRKTHKYTNRIWKNGRWKYFYDTKITGKVYKNNAQKYLDDGGTTKGEVYNEEMVKYYDKSIAGNAEKIKNRIGDKLGIDEREKVADARKSYEEGVQKDNRVYKDRVNTLNKSEEEYEKTPLGKAEKLKKKLFKNN